MSPNLYNLRVPVYKRVPLPWIQGNLSLNNDCWPTIQVSKDSLSEKLVLKYATLGFPFIRGSPQINEMKPILKRWLLANYTSVNGFAFWKVSAKICNFRVPVSKGVPLPWMKWYPSFNDDCWPTIQVWKDSLSEKLVLKYATLGFPFIRGFPSHEWNETLP